MASAIDEVRSGRLGYRSASKKYGVPRSTLERRVKNKNKIVKEVTKSLGSKQRIFSDAMEADLMRYILRMEELYFGLKLMDLRHMAYQIAEQNGLIYLFIHSSYFYIASSSPLLFRGAPNTARILCLSFTPKNHRQLRVKDLPKIPTWRLKRYSNPRPFGRNEPSRPKLGVGLTAITLTIWTSLTFSRTQNRSFGR